MTDTAIRNPVRRMLSERRRELLGEVENRLADIEFALRIRVEALTRIDEALLQLDAGNYGSCVVCGSDISERRLRALPFAVRCQVCEEGRDGTRD